MFIEEVKKELTTHIIPYWEKLKDEGFGGFYGYRGFDLVLDKRRIRALYSTRVYFGSSLRATKCWAIRNAPCSLTTLTNM